MSLCSSFIATIFFSIFPFPPPFIHIHSYHHLSISSSSFSFSHSLNSFILLFLIFLSLIPSSLSHFFSFSHPSSPSISLIHSFSQFILLFSHSLIHSSLPPFILSSIHHTSLHPTHVHPTPQHGGAVSECPLCPHRPLCRGGGRHGGEGTLDDGEWRRVNGR